MHASIISTDTRDQSFVYERQAIAQLLKTTTGQTITGVAPFIKNMRGGDRLFLDVDANVYKFLFVGQLTHKSVQGDDPAYVTFYRDIFNDDWNLAGWGYFPGLPVPNNVQIFPFCIPYITIKQLILPSHAQLNSYIGANLMGRLYSLTPM